jgi:hypothetical protein
VSNLFLTGNSGWRNVRIRQKNLARAASASGGCDWAGKPLTNSAMFMKRKLLLSILGMAAASAFGQGYILLDNYSTYGPNFTYGNWFVWGNTTYGVPANGVSGALGTPGAGLNGSWTAGLYYAIGTPSIFDPMGVGMPNPALSLATGLGSTAQFASAMTGFTPGEFSSSVGFNTGAPAGGVVTVEVVAYDTAGGSYATADSRVHSTPFTMSTVSIITPGPSTVGQAMINAGIPGVSIQWIPEPSAFVLAGLGGLSLLALSRRNKA